MAMVLYLLYLPYSNKSSIFISQKQKQKKKRQNKTKQKKKKKKKKKQNKTKQNQKKKKLATQTRLNPRLNEVLTQPTMGVREYSLAFGSDSWWRVKNGVTT